MADEEKKVETETTEEVEELKDDSTEETNTDAKDSSEEQAEDTKEEAKASDTTIDYKSEIEREKSKGKPDPSIAAEKFKERQAKREDFDDSDEDQPLTRDELSRLIEREKETLRQETLKFEAERLARSMTTSPEEAELVMLKWGRMSFDPDTSLVEQIEDAVAVANKRKLISERNEALRALAGKTSANKDTSSSRSQETQSKDDSNVAVSDRQILAESGYTYNAQTRRYEKKLGSGAVLIWDTKTKTPRKA